VTLTTEEKSKYPSIASELGNK